MAPVARYWLPATRATTTKSHNSRAQKSAKSEDTRAWCQLTYEEYQARGLGREPRRGTLELMAQSGQMLWPKPAELPGLGRRVLGLRRERLHFQPMFVERASASCLASALETSLPALDIAGLKDLCRTAKFVVLQLEGDLAPSNVRVKHWYGDEFRQHNELAQDSDLGLLILLDSPCVAHIIHRAMEVTFTQKELIPNLHAVAFTCGLPANHRALANATQEILQADFATDYFPRSAPPVAAAQHSRNVLKLTLLRSKDTRGRDQADGDAHKAEELEALAEAVVSFFNGDWRLPVCQHYCSGPDCCESREDAVDRGSALMMRVIFDELGKKLPSCIKFDTFPVHLERQGLGMMLHDSLSRVLRSAFERQEAGEEQETDGDIAAWKLYAMRLLNRSLDFADDESSRMFVASACAVTTPLDKLSNRLQHLDSVGSGIMELVSPTGLLHECQIHLWALLNDWSELEHSSDLDTLDHHFFSPDGFVDAARGYVLALSAQVWALEAMRLVNNPVPKMGLDFSESTRPVPCFY